MFESADSLAESRGTTAAMVFPLVNLGPLVNFRH